MTNYQLHGKLVTELTRGTDKLHFFYDAQSRPAMVEYNGVMYTYVHNLQGDIVGILNGSGAVVVEYSYDAWGRLTGVTGSMAATLGEVNLFRYRGYVYDEETGLYFLRSRYYNPVWQRFVNADRQIANTWCIFSLNNFVYCNNDSIVRIDKAGLSSIYGIPGEYTYGYDVYFYNEQYVSDYLDQLQRELAHEKYNEQNVHVYVKGESEPIEGMINVRFYNPKDGYVNIRIEESLSISDTYEMAAILDVIKEHPMFDSSKYGTQSHMIAQWIAHNTEYKLANGNKVDQSLAKLFARSSLEDAKKSSKQLDLREYGNFTKTQRVIYKVIELLFVRNY